MDPEPQFFPAPVTKYNMTNTKIREIIPDPHPVQDPVVAAQFLHMYVYSIFGQFCPKLETDGFTDRARL
jgi:acetoacetate decarboxylase